MIRLGALAWIALGALAACHSPDACDRAVARLGRIENARHARHVSAAYSGMALDACREHVPDPVLHCALTAPTDEAAAACIDAFTRDVMGPPPPPGAPRPPEGQGLNPLLDDQ